MPLYCDIYEVGSGIPTLLKSKNLAVEVKHIESGDYVFGEVAIERKTISDLIYSVTSGDRHFWKQLEVMRDTYKQPILLIEGRIDITDRLTMGILSTVLLFWKYQMVNPLTRTETVAWIANLFTKYGIGKSNRIPPAAVRKHKEIPAIQLEMLQCIERIGPTKAKAILAKFPDIFKNDLETIIRTKQGNVK